MLSRVGFFCLRSQGTVEAAGNEGKTKMKSQLSGSHRRIYDGIFRHPAARNLDWRDVRSMLGALAEVVEEPNGNLKVTRSGQSLVLRPSLHKNVAEIEELMEIRHFLERSGAVEPQAQAA